MITISCSTYYHQEREWIEEEKKMDIKKKFIEQDIGMGDDVRSMKEILKMANSICPVLLFTGDCPGANTNGETPILDINCWVEENHVLYEHYTKPIASNLVIPQRSAIPEKVKRETITQMAIKKKKKTEKIKQLRITLVEKSSAIIKFEPADKTIRI